MKKKNYNLLSLSFLMFVFTIVPNLAFSQGVLIQESAKDKTEKADPSAMLEVKSTNKGLLIPSMTSLQREAILTPANGLMVFDTTEACFYYYDATKEGKAGWVKTVSGDANIGSGTAGKVAYFQDATTISAHSSVELSNLAEEPIFVVKNSEGQTVFAVYEKGVRIYVDSDTVTTGKTARGGFAVGGFTTGKADMDFLKVTPDSVRIYVNDDPLKTARGGFAVGGFTTAKGSTEYLRVTPDSVRVFIDTNPTKTARGGFAVGGFTTAKDVPRNLLQVSVDSTRIYVDDRPGKTARGGFAVGGFTTQKGAPTNYFNVETDNTQIISPSEPRVLWYPLSNAFLAGQVLIVHPDSVGANSWASGYETKAKGAYSQAIGYQTLAEGMYSTALGRGAIAKQETSFSFGYESVAKGQDSYAFGAGALALAQGSYAFGSMGRDTTDFNPTDFPTKAEGNFSFAIGLGAYSQGIASTSIGNNTHSQGNNSLAMGAFSLASAKYAVAIGNEANAGGINSLAMGYQTTASSWGASAFGNGTTASGSVSTAFGSSTIASGFVSTAMGDNTTASQHAATALGYGTEASGNYSLAAGYNTTASAEGAISIGRNSSATAENAIAIGTALESSGINASVALGYFSTASGESSLAIGRNCTASASVSTALGYYATADGYASSAFGSSTTASGAYSTAMGNYTSALSGYEMVVGRYNTLYTPASTTGWNSADRLFVVANGTASTTRSNAMTILKSGNVGIGTESPSQALSIDGNLNLEGGTRYILMSGGNGYLRTTDASSHLYFQTGGAFTRMMISGVDGKVGIGTTSPSYKLHVNSASGEGALRVQVSGNTRLLVNSDESVIVGTNQSTGPARGLYVYGATGLGVLSPSSKLHVDDNAVGPVARFSNNGNDYSRHGIYINAGGNTSSGDHWLIRFYGGDGSYHAGSVRNSNGNLALVQPSDKSLKMNIGNADFNAIDILKNLRVAKYQYKDTRDPAFFNTGYIAQEVQLVLPDMVSEDPETGNLGISTSYLIPVLHKAIQEQQQQIQQMEERIEQLEKLLQEIIAE